LKPGGVYIKVCLRGAKFNKEALEWSRGMAKKKGVKALDDHIAELEAVVGQITSCPACGWEIDAGVTTCPHCGTPVHEAAELQAKAAESLENLGKDLEASTGGEPDAPLMTAPPPPPPEEEEDEGLASAAALAESVDGPLGEAPEDVVPEPPKESDPVEAEALPEATEPEELEGFIAGIEAEVGVEPARAKTQAASAASARAVRRAPAARASHSGRWVAAVAAGAVLYFLAVFLLALLGKIVAGSFMIVGAVLVVAGINRRPTASRGPPRASGRASAASDYVCPLCGTEISATAAECPTCGAVFVA